ncbi:Rho family guanine nucleotide exchange factor TUS1 SCDLUD_004312 [Saccharomycodes ludwigii]|uniref:Rho family guanine nucleotide exchange factor TUS1 n=1 Tax=Saccharomycodes ludwigii TaxID=36035 RepID=UPI001E86030F|nr:hypothetical protein SCDLUD_004312 [Saccharomycodes ludwigii]KAH3899995.1 hypothetical protein SCDLUD_004312 [Saccharomycodes ludwigii]
MITDKNMSVRSSSSNPYLKHSFNHNNNETHNNNGEDSIFKLPQLPPLGKTPIELIKSLKNHKTRSIESLGSSHSILNENDKIYNLPPVPPPKDYDYAELAKKSKFGSKKHHSSHSVSHSQHHSGHVRPLPLRIPSDTFATYTNSHTNPHPDNEICKNKENIHSPFSSPSSSSSSSSTARDYISPFIGESSMPSLKSQRQTTTASRHHFEQYNSPFVNDDSLYDSIVLPPRNEKNSISDSPSFSSPPSSSSSSSSPPAPPAPSSSRVSSSKDIEIMETEELVDFVNNVLPPWSQQSHNLVHNNESNVITPTSTVFRIQSNDFKQMNSSTTNASSSNGTIRSNNTLKRLNYDSNNNMRYPSSNYTFSTGSQKTITTGGSRGNALLSDYNTTTNTNINNRNSHLRLNSFNSVLGAKPLQEVPSVNMPTQPFSIDLIDDLKLYQCKSIYNLSDIYEWLLKIYFEWFNEYIFYKFDFFQLVQLLLEFQLPTFHDQDVLDSNVDRIIESLILQEAIRFEDQLQQEENSNGDEITIVVAGLNISGVFTGLLPCYSCNHGQKDNNTAYKYACYSNTCQLFLKERESSLKHNNSVGNSNSQNRKGNAKLSNRTIGIWSDYWHLTSEELHEINPREVKRQSFIFDLIILEEKSMNLANAAVEIYGRNFEPDLLPKDPTFYTLAFEIFVPLINLHMEHLSNPIFHKLETRGKFIDGVGKIYLKWCHEARQIYIEYAEAMATVHEIINWEKKNHSRFSIWLQKMDNSPEITKSKIYYDVVFFGGFFKSLQNIPVTLNSILKNTDKSMEDYDYLCMAIQEIERLNSIVDKVHGEAVDRRKVIRLSRQLIIGNTLGYANLGTTATKTITVSGTRPLDANLMEDDTEERSANDTLDLRLNEKSRRLIQDGILLKKRDLWLEPSQVHVFLLDNYFLITEPIKKTLDLKYKLLERPIPIDYLSLETKQIDDGNGSLPSTPIAPIGNFNRSFVSSPATNIPLMSTLQHKFLSSSTNVNGNSTENVSTVSSSITSSSDYDHNSNSQQQFHFKIRNTATNESFTFTTNNQAETVSWLQALLSVLKSKNAENGKSQIFKLECLNDMFVYEDRSAPTNLPVTTDGSVIDAALKKFYPNGIVAATVNSEGIKGSVLFACKFTYEGRIFILCAISHGIYMTEVNKKTSWKLILKINKIKSLVVNLKFNMLFVLYDRKLIYFSVPSIMLAYCNSVKYLTQNQLVGILIADKVSYFTIAENFENSRHLVYEKKGILYFMTPEYDRIDNTVRFFKLFKSYKLPANTLSFQDDEVEHLVVFNKSFIVCCSKGVFLFNESFNESGIQLPTIPSQVTHGDSTYNYDGSHHGVSLDGNSVATSSHSGISSSSSSSSSVSVDSSKSKEKMLKFVRNDILNNKTKPKGCFKLSTTGEYVVIYDEAVIKMNKHGVVTDWRSDILVLDFYCHNCSMNNEFLILCGENLIQIYDFSGDNIRTTNLNRLTPVQIIKGKRIKLVSSGNIDDTIISLSHPMILGRQLVIAFHN